MKITNSDIAAGVVVLAVLAVLGLAFVWAVENTEDPKTPGVNRAEIIENLQGRGRK